MNGNNGPQQTEMNMNIDTDNNNMDQFQNDDQINDFQMHSTNDIAPNNFSSARLPNSNMQNLNNLNENPQDQNDPNDFLQTH